VRMTRALTQTVQLSFLTFTHLVPNSAPLSGCAVLAEFRCGKLKREGSKMTCVNIMQHA
jgi:hypothetical protein